MCFSNKGRHESRGFVIWRVLMAFYMCLGSSSIASECDSKTFTNKRALSELPNEQFTFNNNKINPTQRELVLIINLFTSSVNSDSSHLRTILSSLSGENKIILGDRIFNYIINCYDVNSYETRSLYHALYNRGDKYIMIGVGLSYTVGHKLKLFDEENKKLKNEALNMRKYHKIIPRQKSELILNYRYIDEMEQLNEKRQ